MFQKSTHVLAKNPNICRGKNNTEYNDRMPCPVELDRRMQMVNTIFFSAPNQSWEVAWKTIMALRLCQFQNDLFNDIFPLENLLFLREFLEFSKLNIAIVETI